VKCEEVQKLIDSYADGELSILQAEAVKNHLNDCPRCGADHQHLAEVSDLIRREGRFTPPPQLHAHIRERLRQFSDEAPTRTRLPQWLTFAVPSLAFGFVLAWGLALVIGPISGKVVTDQLISAHVRSLMVDHLTDVSSSDQHTVKPWFNGKLDFAPPVEDFTRKGFPLIGGRLDYLDNQPVAALVYRHRQHIINLFIHSSHKKSGNSVRIISQRGYHVLSWNRAGLGYWAISDLNLKDIKKFVALFRATNTPAPLPDTKPSGVRDGRTNPESG